MVILGQGAPKIIKRSMEQRKIKKGAWSKKKFLEQEEK